MQLIPSNESGATLREIAIEPENLQGNAAKFSIRLGLYRVGRDLMALDDQPFVRGWQDIAVPAINRPAIAILQCRAALGVEPAVLIAPD